MKNTYSKAPHGSKFIKVESQKHILNSGSRLRTFEEIADLLPFI